ncbi:MAG TPA: alpha/beta hydrolase [Actinospica sp.]|jgi:pimeloyl-ACP methyl ester carboxylesterase|nr:alpha/beta hydrolase [Actinospica sp.]
MLTVIEHDLVLGDGRTLRCYDTRAADGSVPGLAVLWSHGTPNVGEPPAPLFAAAAERGIRFVGYDRPGYGPSTARPGRTVGSAAEDAAAVLDALGISRFAMLGHSGGGPHTLACAALLADRLIAVVDISGPAPYGGPGLDYFTGMNPSGEAELRASVAGRAALVELLESSEYDPEMFTPADHAALQGSWDWMMTVVNKALKNGDVSGMIDDDLAYVAPWGFEVTAIHRPLLVCHGEHDRIVPAAHGRWVAATVASAELRTYPADGHVSVLESAGVPALDWIREQADA